MCLAVGCTGMLLFFRVIPLIDLQHPVKLIYKVLLLQTNAITVHFYTDSRGGGLKNFITANRKFQNDNAHVVIQAGGH